VGFSRALLLGSVLALGVAVAGAASVGYTITGLGSFLAAGINADIALVGGPSIDSGGTVQGLNNLIRAGSGYQIHEATAINDKGETVPCHRHRFRLNHAPAAHS